MSRATAPTSIELDPPSNPDTPSEMPGTPNSATTSLSALSTTAIKDGHRGSAFPSSGHHHSLSTNTLEAERADRISRLAGLERVGTVRPNAPGGTGGPTSYGTPQGQIPGYFDASGNPVYTTKMSTVGSASATDSAVTPPAWASVSGQGQDDEYSEADKMSMDTNYRDMDERDRYSAMDVSEDGNDGMSDEGNASLVGFGEGAGSTVSGPTYTRSRASQIQAAGGGGIGSPASTTTGAMEQRRDARMMDGITDDTASGYVDTTMRSPVPGRGPGVAAAERIVRERLDDGEGKRPAMSTPEEAGLGKFYFEEKS